MGGDADVAERELYREKNKGSVSPLKDPVTGQIYHYQAGHRVNSHLIDPARHRILNSEYDPANVFGGKHSDAAPHVEQMRQSIADPSNPAHDWESAYEQLGPDGREIVSKLEIKETNLNLTSHERYMNYPELYHKYERSITSGLPKDAWVHTHMQETGSIYGRPESITTRVDFLTGDKLRQIQPSLPFSNVDPRFVPLK